MGDTKHTRRISEHPILRRVLVHDYIENERPENRGTQSNYAYNCRHLVLTRPLSVGSIK